MTESLRHGDSDRLLAVVEFVGYWIEFLFYIVLPLALIVGPFALLMACWFGGVK